MEQLQGTIVPGSLGDIQLNPGRMYINMNWYMETFNRILDANPKSNGTNVNGLSFSEAIDLDMLFTPTLPVCNQSKKGVPFSRHIKEFENLTNVVADEDSKKYVTDIMHFASSQVLAHNASKNKPMDNTAKKKSAEVDYDSPTAKSTNCDSLTFDNVPQLASLSQTDRKSKHKRQRPGNSPRKSNIE